MLLPKLIILDGTSSSGKTSIARLFQNEITDVSYHYVSLDYIEDMMPANYYGTDDYKERVPPHPLGTVVTRLNLVRHRLIATMINYGFFVIADHAITWKYIYQDLNSQVSRFSPIWVKVYCPLDELIRREKERNDRPTNQAAEQFEQIHKFVNYHLEIDTSILSIEQSTDKLIAFLEKNDYRK